MKGWPSLSAVLSNRLDIVEDGLHNFLKKLN